MDGKPLKVAIAALAFAAGAVLTVFATDGKKRDAVVKAAKDGASAAKNRFGKNKEDN